MTNEAELRERVDDYENHSELKDPIAIELIRDLLTLLDEKDKVIERLPITKDGVRVVPGMDVWFIYDDGSGVCNDFAPDFEMMDGDWDMYYSTREAAEAAREEGGGDD